MSDSIKMPSGDPGDNAASATLVSGSGPQGGTPVTPETGGGQAIFLDAVITIAEAAAFKDRLLPHSNRQGEIMLDGSRVASVDTAGLQVLLAFIRAVQGHGATVRWSGVSEALLTTAQLLGVAGMFGLRD